MLGFSTGRAVRRSAERFAAAPAEIVTSEINDLVRDRFDGSAEDRDYESRSPKRSPGVDIGGFAARIRIGPNA
jgi:hypothetical protein